jgi:molybdopterin molybdotransferase
MSTAAQTQVLSFAEARLMVEKYAGNVKPTDPELMSLLDAVGLVLAEDLRADRDFPPFPRATRDGFAVRAEDLHTLPAHLRCIGELKAGASPEQSRVRVGTGEAVEIMTGAPVPAGTDAVVMVEYTERLGAEVTVKRGVQAGENVVAAGSEAGAGQVMVARGTRVNHAVVGVAAAVGKPEVATHMRPRVAIIATGDELVDINLPPGPNEIRNSNSYSLAAQVYGAGGEPVILPVAQDDAGDLEVLIRQGLSADLLLLSGGVSMGKYDLVEQVLDKLGAKFFFTGVLIQPGKPLVFGELKYAGRTAPFFGLPGNPVSTMVTFQLFAKPLLDGLAGASPAPPPFSQALLASELRIKTGLTRFLPARLAGTREKPTVEAVRWQGSGDMMALGRANCYIVAPPDRERFEAGETITILPFCHA